MGFFRGPDKIGTISHSAGVVSLGLPPGSLMNRLTIRGQQYDFGPLSRTISADVAIAPNLIYMVYAVVVGTNVQLRVSANFNSAGPAGFTAWTLVGAFYSNHASAVFTNYRIDIPLDLDVSVIAGNVSTNATVFGRLSFASNSDSLYGILQTESGGYNAATGAYAVRQPMVWMPVAGVFKASFNIGWTTTAANFTNTWQAQWFKNNVGLGAVARNGWGTNNGSTLNFIFIDGSFRIGVAQGEFLDLRTYQDLANPLTAFSNGVTMNFKSNVALREM